MTEITDLTLAGTITGAELVALLQGGGAVKAPVSQLTAAMLNYTAAPVTAPTVAVNAVAGNINGTCYYMVTFVTAVGETDSVVNSSAVSPANQRVNLTGIPVSSDPDVVARRIYRTPAGAVDSVLGKLVATISDNTTTTYADNVADGSLGAAVPRINGTGGTIKANALAIASANSRSTRFGELAMPALTSYASTAFGSRALGAVTNGFRNTAIGVDAMSASTTAYENTAVGVHALGFNLTGKQNCAMGYQALQFGATGDYNNAFGVLALAQNTGSGNIGIGAQALQLHTTGDGNVAVGRLALFAGGGAVGNTAVGNGAGSAEGTGNFNTFVGNSAAPAVSGASTNTAVGAFTLNALTTGGNNVAVGSFAGYYETGNNALWIDNQTRASLADAKTKALLWGTFGTTVAGQQLTVNGQLNVKGGLATPLASKSGSYTMVASDGDLIFTAAATLTLLAASSCPNREIKIVVKAAAAIVSASSNVVPLAGGAARTAILPATAGKFAVLKSDGTNWQIMLAN